MKRAQNRQCLVNGSCHSREQQKFWMEGRLLECDDSDPLVHSVPGEREWQSKMKNISKTLYIIRGQKFLQWSVRFFVDNCRARWRTSQRFFVQHELVGDILRLDRNWGHCEKFRPRSSNDQIDSQETFFIFGLLSDMLFMRWRKKRD